MRTKNPWRLWAKALGEKASKDDKESDHVAGIRTFLFCTYFITNCFIVAGVIRHWNKPPIVIEIYEVPSRLPETKEERIFQTNRNFAYD